MKKKGFTLVELLAVIAILAVLVIIALPNIIEMFGGAKKKIFVTEIRELHHLASHDWIVDSFSISGSKTYIQTKEECSTCKKIDANVRDNLEYQITISSSGNITKFYATDGSYQYGYSGDGLSIKDISDDNVYEIANLELKPLNAPATIKNTKLVISATGNNIDTSGFNLQPLNNVTVSYYYNNMLVDADIFDLNDGPKYFATFNNCDNNGSFLNWETEDGSRSFGANQEITQEIVDELGKNIKLKAMCRFNFLPKPGVNQSTY